VTASSPAIGAKALGPIPPGYGCVAGELAIDGIGVTELVREAGGTPAFLYSRALIERRVANLRAALPAALKINYAVKANPYQPILALLKNLVDGFDIASAGELAMVQAAGVDPRQVSFAGPGKDDGELAAAISTGVTLNIESAGELDRALLIARRAERTLRAALRVNPDFTLRGSGMKMGGGAKPFGIDAAAIPQTARKLLASGAADLRGLHIFTGSQALEADAVIAMQRAVLDLAQELALEIGQPLPMLNMGGGFGVPYFPGDAPLDIDAVGSALAEALSDLPSELRNTALHIELGRYLVAEAGVYVTRIIDRKVSHGQVFLVTDGGLHHQLAASGNFGTVVRRNYPISIATRCDEEPSEVASVVGRLCTPLDRLADNGWFQRAGPGDLVAVFCAGAYGASASPMHFLGHGPAREMLV
jgi:diaminopimelate decarboxylase